MIMLVRYLESDTRSKTLWSMVFVPPFRSGIGTRTLPGNREDAYRAGITPRILRRTGDDSTVCNSFQPSAIRRPLKPSLAESGELLPFFSRMLDLGKKGWASV